MNRKCVIALLTAAAAVCVSAGTIVTGPNPNRYDKIAEQELLEFLPKLSGEKWDSIPETQWKKTKEKTIFLGSTAFAQSKGLNRETFSREEWRIKSFPEGMVITGGKTVGALYGAYDLLKKYGVRFLAMDEIAVPAVRKFELLSLDVKQKPSYDARLVYDWYPNMIIEIYKGDVNIIHKTYHTHALRSGVNGTQLARHPALYMGEFWKRTVGNICHNYVYYIPPAKYMKDHPEYYSMNKDGKRYFGQFCFSNPEVPKILLNSLREFIKRDRKESWFGVGEYKVKLDDPPTVYLIGQMDDSNRLCYCPECTKIHEEDGDSGLQLRALNYVAREIRKEYPEIKIATMAYCSTDTPPKVTKPEPNIYFQYDDLYVSSDCYRPLTHPVNKDQFGKLNAWLNYTDHFLLSDFGNLGGKNYFYPPRQEVTIDACTADLRYAYGRGVRLYFEEYEKDPMVPQPFFDLHCYVKHALLLDINADTEKLISEFIQYYYGEKAAPYMADYFAKLRKGVKEHPTPQRTMLVTNWKFCTPEFLCQSYVNLAKAEKAAGKNTRFGRRIREEMLPLMWEILYYRKNNQAAMKKCGLTVDDLRKKCLAYTKEYISKYGGKAVPARIKEMEDKFNYLFIDLNADDKFPGYSPNDIKVFGYPHAVAKKGVSEIVNDKDTPVGKALRCPGPKGVKHGRKAQQWNIWATYFALHDGKVPRGTIGVRVKPVPQDEKYHWYKVPDILDCAKGEICLWSLYGYLEFNMATLWRYVDGREDLNRYQIWFSAKFTGPSYVKGSKQEDAIWVDRIVAIWEKATPAEAKKK